MELRPATLQDAEAIHALMSSVIEEGAFLMSRVAPEVELYRQYLAGALQLGAPVWVACNAGRLIGWCDLHPRPNPEQRHVGRLGIGVARAWRGRGVGQALMQVVIDKAWRVGFHRLELEVFVDNERAIRLYERHGFRREGRHRAVRRDADGYRDSLTMALLNPG